MMDIRLKKEKIKLKAISHPGFDYTERSDREKVTKTCRFGGDKVAIVGEEGAFFGREPRYVEFKSTHTFSCLTVFRSRKEASDFVEFLNMKIRSQLKMTWLDAR